MLLSDKELRELGRARDGSLAQTPFPVLLQALFLAERTAVIELRQRNLEKRISLEDGVPVECESNLLHETCGKFLVEKHKIDEAQYQKALTESALSGEPFEQVVLRLKMVQPFDLFKLLQQNLAFKILDCFCANWSDAKFRVLPDPPAVAQPLRVNLAQLVLTGVSTFSPFAEVERVLAPLSGQALALSPKPPHAPNTIKPSPKDARLMQELRKGATIEELAARTGVEMEDALRKAYALLVLGYADTLERVAEQLTAAPPPAPAPAPEAVPVIVAAEIATGPSPEEIERLRNEVTKAYLSYRTKDAFDLLMLDEQSSAPMVREAFLIWSEQFAPWRFKEGELAPLQEKARDLFLAGARAYAELSNPETRAQVAKRRAAAKESAVRKRSTDFSIKTDLLDAKSQHDEGLRRLEKGEYKAALNYLEFAADCDPRKAIYRAHLAWARFKAEPRVAERQALGDLDEAIRIDPNCGEAMLYAGEIHHFANRLDRAEDFLRKASKLLPGDRRPVEALKVVGAERVKAQKR